MVSATSSSKARHSLLRSSRPWRVGGEGDALWRCVVIVPAAGSFSPAVGPLTRSERDQQFYCGLATSGYRLAVAVLATSSRSISDPINVVSIRAVPRKGGADKIADAADYSGAKRLYKVLASQWLRLAERAEETGGIDGAQKASADPMPRQEPQLTPPKSARLNASKTRFSHKREQHKRAPGG